MANYTNQLIENASVFVEQNIWDLRELGTFDSPWYDSPYRGEVAIGLYCREDEVGKYYRLDFEGSDSVWQAIQVPLEALAVKNIKKRQEAILELVKSDNGLG